MTPPDTSPENINRMVERLRYHDMRASYGEMADMLEALAAERDALALRVAELVGKAYAKNVRVSKLREALDDAEANLAASDGTRIEGAIMIFNDQSVEHWGNSTMRFCSFYYVNAGPIRCFPPAVCEWADEVFAEIAKRRAALEGDKP